MKLPILIALLLFSLSALHAAAAPPSSKPNIIFIMADDLGYTDVACFGSKYYETPNIDQLATQGMNDLPILPPQGISLVKAFRNEPLDRDAIYWEHEGNAAVRVDDLKLVPRPN